MFEIEKDTCPKCNSENIITERNYVKDEETGETIYCDSWNAECKDCGYKFLLVNI